MITVIGGGSIDEKDGMTVRGEKIIENAKTVIYQSTRQGCYKQGALSLDKIFEAAKDFDNFVKTAVNFIVSKGEGTVFVAIGDGVNNNVSMELCRHHDNVEIIEGHISGCVSAAARGLGLSFDSLCYINGYDYMKIQPETDKETVIYQIDDKLLFWDIKSKLLDYYPEDTRIFIDKTAVLLKDANYISSCDIFLPKLDILEKKRYSYSDLMSIVRELRKKCPWDKEQTHESIRTNLIEECYELYEAIDEGNSNMMLEEMGDVLLQICLHNVFECEHGDVYEDDVTTIISQKLIRRHPHVYGQAVANTKGEVKAGWDEIKRQEYSLKSKSDELKHISRYLPALMRAYKVVKKAEKQGIEISGDIVKIIEDIKQGRDVENNSCRMLLLMVQLCLRLGIHPYISMNDGVNAFINTVENMENTGNNSVASGIVDVSSVCFKNE